MKRNNIKIFNFIVKFSNKKNENWKSYAKWWIY